ncbi:DoxX family protein [Cohnella faecalis]|uniref:DoxX family protein n=1 Tax=Cohnella faecalis TaxID=2315694 RepID=A0A398CSM6_9BACL|nr:DoxX family protein [Cohnella faecalis]RIE02807.1 DoxX family protein [Cohnella faecalis]RIE04521.1 DoxX family protein [Cohnella faecalis]
MEWGLLLLRVVIGLLFVGHGMQKLAGWFGGYGLNGTGGFFESIGIKPGKTMAFLAGLAEVAGGLLFAFGFLTPLAALLIVGTMLIAIIKVHGKNGLWVTQNGYEFNLVLIVIAIAVALIGPGDYSLDSLWID